MTMDTNPDHLDDETLSALLALLDALPEDSPFLRLDPPQRRQRTLEALKRVMRPLQAHCHHGLGTLYATTSRREQARTELTAATDLYRTMEMTFFLRQAEAALAQVEG